MMLSLSLGTGAENGPQIPTRQQAASLDLETFQRGVRMSGLPTAPGTKALRINASGTISIADTLIDAGGTVTSVATNNGTGITGGTITTSGTLAIDTTVISTRAWRQKGVDSLQANINLKLNISDTASMLSPYLRSNVASATYVPQSRTITINGTAQDLSANRTFSVGTVTSVGLTAGTGISVSGSPVTGSGSMTVTNTAPDQTVVLNSGTGISISGTYPSFTITNSSPSSGGTVTSVGTNNGTGLTGGTITTAGTLAIDTALISTRLWRQKGIDSVQSNLTAGLALKLNISDTSSMLSPYLRKVDTASLSNRINTKLNISDTATMLGNYVNNVGYGLDKAGQVVSVDTLEMSTRAWRQKGIDSVAALINTRISGTTNYIPKFTSSSAIGNSILQESGGTLVSTGRYVVNTSSSAGVSDISYGAYNSGSWINTPSGTTGYLAVAGSASMAYSASQIISYISGSEQMRLTSTGLGIGTSSPVANTPLTLQAASCPLPMGSRARRIQKPLHAICRGVGPN